MNKYVKRAEQFRNDPSVHYNCAQAVVVSFAAECGISEGKAFQMGEHFGGGMRMAATCGAITGGLMVLGMLGGTEDQRRMFLEAMKANHDGMTDCAHLLKKNAEQGGTRKEHCDGMVYEAVENVAKVMGLE